MLRKAVLIFAGNATASLLLLLRSLLVGRMISVGDFGIAATFALAMAVVEMLSTLGLQQQIVQARDGDEPRLQSALQGFHLLRGVISSLLLLTLAGPIATFMGVPEVAWAYRVMALVPLLGGLTHFDIHRLSRGMNFRPMILSNTLPALGSVLALFVLAIWFGDYRVMLFAILIQAALAALTSHILAERTYRIRLDRKVMLRSLRFGWPLFLNGILLFLVFQGDKIIVGRELGMAPLALLSMGFTLTLAPTLLISRSAQNFFLPQLSAAQDDPVRFERLATVVMQTVLILGLAMLVGITLIGGPFVMLALGERYAALPPLLVWLALMQAIRVFKVGSSIVALSRGQTGNAMIANLSRAVTLPVAWYAAIHGSDLETIIWIGIAGELVGLVISFALIYLRLPLSPRRMALPAAGAALVLVVAMLHGAIGPAGDMGRFPPLWVWAGFALSGVLTLWTMRDLRLYVGKRGSPKGTPK
jgi:O-antigen/teichoic acid export membrane protein